MSFVSFSLFRLYITELFSKLFKNNQTDNPPVSHSKWTDSHWAVFYEQELNKKD